MKPHSRTSRRFADAVGGHEIADSDTEFRRDLERIRFSPYYARLSAVTQVIGQTGAGPLVHNRLTHSLKVTAVARTIATQLVADLAPLAATHPEFCCDPVVAQAAAAAHDLGHPPFGHLGEQVLDRVARETLGLPDGFEGNAQTYRIITALDVWHDTDHGLNLTAASRSATAKYPWTPAVTVDDPEAVLPPGLRRVDGELVVRKYSAYFVDAADLADARAGSAGLLPLQQSLEATVMDIADDIAYSVHDVDDFYRAGLLSQSAVAHELGTWLEDACPLRHLSGEQLGGQRQRPGAALELLRRKLHADDPWIADDGAFTDAVRLVADDLVDGLLAEDFDGSLTTERALSSFTSRWIGQLQNSVVLAPDNNPRTGLVTLDVSGWHAVNVLKFVHRHFILNRPDIAMYQRGLSRVLLRIVNGLTSWLDDRHDRERVPPRLRELVALATRQQLELMEDRPEGIPVPDSVATAHRFGVGRGVLDYVSSLSDDQAFALSEAIDGRPDRLWEIGRSL